MSLLRGFAAYASHPDPLAAASNRIALLVASNQPFYPLYLWWIVGGDWWVGFWTFLSTPFFASVPIVARRNALAGRAMLPLTGIANSILGAKVFGEASGVALFLLPCGLIGLLAFRRAERPMPSLLLGATLIAVLAHGHYGLPVGAFNAEEYAHLLRLNAFSVAALSAALLWILIRARSSHSQR